MKKYIIITAIILSLLPYACAQDTESTVDPYNGLAEIEEMEEHFFEIPTGQLPLVEVKEVRDGSTQKPIKGNPLFKRARIKITNFIRQKDYEHTQKLIEKEKAQEKAAEEKEMELLKEELGDNFEVEEETSEENKSETENVELVGGVKEQVTGKDAQLDADNIDFDDETGDIIATGNPVLKFPPQKTTIIADKMIYNNGSNKIKAYGNVKVTRQDTVTTGDYMQINMNEENAFMDNVDATLSNLKLTSRTSEMDGDKITMYDGKMVANNSYILKLETRTIGGNQLHKMLVDEDEKSSIMGETGDTKINIKAKEVIIDAKKDTNTITFKKARIQYGDLDVFNIHSLTAHTNKNNEYFEANYPEIGSQGRLGMYAGPGFAFDTPLQHGSTIKLVPIINSKKGDIGVGGIMKYRSGTNYTYMAYGSVADMFILKGKQELDDKLYMQYGANSYMDEWFLGRRMARYDAELIYRDKGVIHSTLGKGLDLNIRHRAGIGYMHNNKYSRDGEHIKSKDIGTSRFRYMAEANQTLFKISDPENLKMLKLSLALQGSAAVYGTGDTQFVGRVGPRLHTQYKYWMQDIYFYLSAFEDHTPMRRYDAYRYGRGSIYLREALRVNKYLTLGWSGTVNVTNDALNDKMFQENAFILGIGPDDFKFHLGYDCIRKQTYFGFTMALDTAGSSVEYDKMVIKNPENLSAKEEKVELKVFDNTGEKTAARPKKMMYAEVVDIEDPDKEQI